MRSYVLVAVFNLFIITTSNAQSFVRLSKQIKKECREKGESFHDLRIKLYNLGKLPFLFKADTTFMLQSFDVESGDYYGRIWNSMGEIDYKYSGAKFSFANQIYFTKYTAHIVQKWDTSGIKEEERNYSNLQPERWIKAIRIIKERKDVFVLNCFLFKYFFKVERDARNEN